MNHTVPVTELETPQSNSNGSNGQFTLTSNGQRTCLTLPGLGDHPLWQALMDEMEKNRQADIAEANRLAETELLVALS